MRILPVLMVLLFAGCPHDNCVPDTTRCFANQAQICNSATDWQLIADCTRVEGGGEWCCCWFEGDEDLEIPAGHTCLNCPCPEPPAETE